MQIPVKYVEAAVEPGSTRVRFTVSVPPPTTFQSIDVRANVLAITNEKMRAVFESAGLAELITPVGELSILVPPPPPPPSPTPLREDDDDDDDDKGTLAQPPPTPGLALASLIALSTVVPVGSLIICAIAARVLYVRWPKVRPFTPQGV
ncbi:hypothetical protein KFE25_012260 [Diacronema lutheri]|uniref:Uncharacterized protein n=1 Tax=Diacronema lutheri TaxID=2081491 RepID=A0A8J6CAB5_DIALT|nr:hypothetical protein KFE25_012260 [Diacronema lutheri]